jgi:hypothetical protein
LASNDWLVRIPIEERHQDLSAHARQRCVPDCCRAPAPFPAQLDATRIHAETAGPPDAPAPSAC